MCVWYDQIVTLNTALTEARARDYRAIISRGGNLATSLAGDADVAPAVAGGAAPGSDLGRLVRRLETDVAEQESLLAGFQRENERLVAEARASRAEAAEARRQGEESTAREAALASRRGEALERELQVVAMLRVGDTHAYTHKKKKKKKSNTARFSFLLQSKFLSFLQTKTPARACRTAGAARCGHKGQRRPDSGDCGGCGPCCRSARGWRRGRLGRGRHRSAESPHRQIGAADPRGVAWAAA
jgi:hypothetical protein